MSNIRNAIKQMPMAYKVHDSTANERAKSAMAKTKQISSNRKPKGMVRNNARLLATLKAGGAEG
jgi:hypothetical protein